MRSEALVARRSSAYAPATEEADSARRHRVEQERREVAVRQRAVDEQLAADGEDGEHRRVEGEDHPRLVEGGEQTDVLRRARAASTRPP